MILKKVKPIPGYNNYYATDYGEIISFIEKTRPKVAGIFLKKFIRNNYHCVNLWINGIMHKVDVHRLIALTFIPNPNNYKYVHHQHGIKLDNRASKLEWIKQSDNISHSWKERKK